MSKPTWIERHPDYVGLVMQQVNEARELSNSHAAARMRLATELRVRREQLDNEMANGVIESIIQEKEHDPWA